MGSLSEVLAGLAPADSDGYAAEPSDDWRQGRTLYGGLTTALCVESARRHIPSLPPVRAIQVAFVGPAVGRIGLRPTLLRQGRSAAFVAVDATADDGLCARATISYGTERAHDVTHERTAAPAVADPADCGRAPLEGGPSFLVHFDVRSTGGQPPFSGGAPELTMWVRHRDLGTLDPTIALVALADVLPPAAAVAYRELRPMSSMTWSLELMGTPQPTEWHLLRSTSEHAADGYSVQTMGIWDRAGRCLGVGRQVVALF